MSIKLSGNLSFTTLTTGTVIAPDASGDALLPAGTYFVEIGDPEHHRSSIQWEWSAALAATITYERTNQTDATLAAAASTQWKDTGIAALTAVATGLAADTVIREFADQVCARMRAKIVVTTQGLLRGNAAFKAL